MNKKKNVGPAAPEEPVIPEPALQITPVEFSPTVSPDAIGTVRPQRWPDAQYPVFVPIFIILLVLNGSTLRDIIALNSRMKAIAQDNQPALEMLKNSAPQFAFRDNLRTGIERLAITDPVAAKIARDYFPKTNVPPPANPNATTTPEQ